MKRHKRHIDIDTRLGLDLEGPLRDVILRLQDFQEKYNDYEGVRIDEDACYEGGYTYNLQRLETDLEYEQRLAKEADWTLAEIRERVAKNF